MNLRVRKCEPCDLLDPPLRTTLHPRRVQKSNFDARIVQPETTFKIGDIVLLKNRNARKHSLADRHTSPYQLHKFTKNGNVELINMDGRAIPGRHKPTKLKVYSKQTGRRFC